MPEDENDQSKYENILIENQRKYLTLLDNLSGMAYRCRNDEGWTMEFMSRGCEALTGYGPEDLIDNKVLSYSDIVFEEDRDRVWNSVQQGVQKRESFKMEYRIRTKDGKIKWVWEQGQGIFSDDGDLMALEGFITDITDKIEAREKLRLANQELASANEELTASNEEFEAMNEEFEAMNEELIVSQNKIESINTELKESERKYATLLDNLPGMVYRCRNDKDWTMEYVSEGSIDITGYKAEDLIKSRKLSYNDIIHPDDREKVWEWVQEAIDEKKPFSIMDILKMLSKYQYSHVNKFFIIKRAVFVRFNYSYTNFLSADCI